MSLRSTHDPVSVRPLLRAIAREIRERRAAAATLEGRVEVLGEATGRRREEMLELRAQLAAHRLALRLASKELEELGWALEEGDAPMLVMKTGGGIERLAWKPEQTGFYPKAYGAGL